MHVVQQKKNKKPKHEWKIENIEGEYPRDYYPENRTYKYQNNSRSTLERIF